MNGRQKETSNLQLISQTEIIYCISGYLATSGQRVYIPIMCGYSVNICTLCQIKNVVKINAIMVLNLNSLAQ